MWRVFAAVGPAIDAAHIAQVVEGEALVLGGDGFQGADGFDVQGAQELQGAPSFSLSTRVRSVRARWEISPLLAHLPVRRGLEIGNPQSASDGSRSFLASPPSYFL